MRKTLVKTYEVFLLFLRILTIRVTVQEPRRKVEVTVTKTTTEK